MTNDSSLPILHKWVAFFQQEKLTSKFQKVRTIWQSILHPSFWHIHCWAKLSPLNDLTILIHIVDVKAKYPIFFSSIKWWWHYWKTGGKNLGMKHLYGSDDRRFFVHSSQLWCSASLHTILSGMCTFKLSSSPFFLGAVTFGHKNLFFRLHVGRILAWERHFRLDLLNIRGSYLNHYWRYWYSFCQYSFRTCIKCWFLLHYPLMSSSQYFWYLIWCIFFAHFL